MKRKLAAICMVALLICLGGCKYTKDGDAGYKPYDDYVLPTSGQAEKDSVPYVIAKIIEKGQVVRDYNRLTTSAIGATEAYSIRTNGITVEFYKFSEDSSLLAEIKKLNAYPIRDDAGKIVETKKAVINSHFVMMIPAQTNSNGDDISALNEKLITRFKELEL